jgi:hypothetical protein
MSEEERFGRKLQAVEESLDSQQSEQVIHSELMRALKEQHAKEIEGLKEAIRELIDLETSVRQVGISGQMELSARNSFHHRIEDLKERFKE